MPDSATTGRDRRREETARALTRAARLATAEHGLSGFTVEDVCESAGVSRRTFFNYFASKEDAVLGFPLARSDDEAVERFLAGGTASGTLSPTLLVALTELAYARWHALDLTAERIRELVAAVEREPRLIARMLERAFADETADAALVARREHLADGDPRAEVTAQMIGALSRGAAAEFLSPGNTESIADIFARRVAAASDLFATQTPLPLTLDLELETP